MPNRENGNRRFRLRILAIFEWLSIVFALLLTASVLLFCWGFPGYSPDANIARNTPAWIVLIYMAVQLYDLVATAVEKEKVSDIDAVIASLPAFASVIVFVLWAAGVWKLSGFQANCVSLAFFTGLIEFLVTLRVKSLIDLIKGGGV